MQSPIAHPQLVMPILGCWKKGFLSPFLDNELNFVSLALAQEIKKRGGGGSLKKNHFNF